VEEVVAVVDRFLERARRAAFLVDVIFDGVGDVRLKRLIIVTADVLYLVEAIFMVVIAALVVIVGFNVCME